MKKIISITLALLMLFSSTCLALTPEAAAGDLGPDRSWKLADGKDGRHYETLRTALEK